MKMRKEEYIQEVISRIENKRAKIEVEKELSAHIDDRISYYTDAGWDEETANVKAMEHMGSPEKVSEEMGKLHVSNRKKKFIALMCVLSVYTTVHFMRIIFFPLNIWGPIFLSIWHLAIIIVDFLISSLLFGSVIVSYKNRGAFYHVAIGIQIAILLKIAFLLAFEVEYPYYLFSFVVIVSTLVLTVVSSCEKTDTAPEKTTKKVFVGFAFSTACILTAVALMTVTVFTVSLIEDSVNKPIEKAYNERLETVKREYLLEKMPKEVATEEEVAGIDIEKLDFGHGFDLDNPSAENWRLDQEKIKPTKRFPAKYNSDYELYYLTNSKGVVMSVSFQSFDPDFFDLNDEEEAKELTEEDLISTYYLIEGDYNYPDFEKAKVSEMRVNDTDISSAFSDEELEIIRSVINNPEYVGTTALDYDMKFSKIEWTFEEAKGFINRTGYYIADSAGSYYISSSINTIRDSNGNITTSTGLFRLDDYTAEKLKTLLSYEKFTTDYSD
jgi:hypothetical protein